MHGLFLSNLPTNITLSQLTAALRAKLHEDDTNFICKLFESPDGIRRTAVVSGFKSSLDSVIEKLQGVLFDTGERKRNIQIKYDRGDERDKFGTFLKPFNGPEKRLLSNLTGSSTRKVTFVLNAELFSSLGEVSSLHTSMAHVYMNDLGLEELAKAGEVISAYLVKRHNETLGHNFYRVTYKTGLELLQAMSLFNKLPTSKRSVLFTDETGKKLLSLDRQCGIGSNKEIIDIRGIQNAKGYIPFSMLDSSILDEEKIQTARSTCWKCLSGSRFSTFSLVGVSADLTYIAGTCNCHYLEDLPVLHIDRPFKHGVESFTRLIKGRNVEDSSVKMNLIIKHEKMKLSYESPSEYLDIVAPILLDEWKTFSTQFKKENTTRDGLVLSYKLIETIITEKNQEICLFFVELSVPKSNIWSEETLTAIRHVTVTMDVETSKGLKRKREIRKAKLSQAHAHNDTCISLYTRLELPNGYKPVVKSAATLVPKPSKIEYESTVRTMKGWANGKYDVLELGIILSADADNFLTVTGTVARQIWGPLRRRYEDHYNAIVSSFNAEQQTAFDTAKTFAVSVVQGPPGTGKTYWAAAATNMLHSTERGVILACASSNEAANALAISIRSTSRKLAIPLSVCRVYSKSKENYFQRINKNPMSDTGVPCLHNVIRKDPLWLKGEKLVEIRKMIEEDKQHLLTDEQQKVLELHIGGLEKKALDLFAVIVTTIGSLSDQRIASWNGNSKITTVFIDEVGQTKQTEVLFLLTLGQKRTCFIGDQMQLRPLVNSFSASEAGLDISCIEKLEKGGKRVPWTLLKEQHRMNPQIRDLTSHLAYNNELRDAPSINARPDTIPKSVYQSNRYLEKSDIFVFNHGGLEEKVSMTQSVFNDKEAALVSLIVGDLICGGMEASKITVLTLYESQKRLIKTKLGKKANDIDVKNVDAFQGKENQVIVLSISRSNIEGFLGFAKIINRVNVAVSRAMFKLIVCCNLDFMLRTKVGAIKRLAEKLKISAYIISGKDYFDLL